jgi:CrcB protein
MKIWLAVALGGAIGAVLRFAVSRGAANVFGTAFPWGTLIVNAVGAFAIGFLAAWFASRLAVGPALRALVLTGVLGALTTFSTFSLETLALAQVGAYGRAAANVVVNLGLSLVLVWAGFAFGSRV